MDDPKETLIRREYTRTACQSIALHETLTQMFAQNFDHTATLRVGELVPLEIPAGVLESGI